MRAWCRYVVISRRIRTPVDGPKPPQPAPEHRLRTSENRIASRRYELRTGGTCGNAVLEIDPIARRHPQQVSSAPDDVILELAHLTVGVHQFPHHLANAQPTRLLHR